MTRRSLFALPLVAVIPAVAKRNPNPRQFYHSKLGDFGKVYLNGAEVPHAVWCSIKHGSVGRYVTNPDGSFWIDQKGGRASVREVTEFGRVEFYPREAGG